MSEPQVDLDETTGLPNREAVERLLALEWRRTARDKRFLAALLIEVDDFEALAHESGPDAARECLRRVGRCIRRTCHRAGDVVARFDDAQFLALLPRADDVGAGSVADRLRRSIANLAIPNARSSVGPWVTVSVGSAAMLAGNDQRGDELITECRERLAEARRAGKNRRVSTPARPSGPVVLGAINAIAGGPARRESRATVLVADDTAAVVESLSSILTALGSTVRVARNGAAALAAVQRERPDVVLFGSTLRDADGGELWRRLRSASGAAELPIIVVGPADLVEQRQRAFDAGAADFIHPPFHAPEVAARIRHQVELVRLSAALGAMTSRVRELENLRGSLSATLVNDIRSPLASVQASLDALGSNASPDSGVTADAAARVKRVVDVVTDLLDTNVIGTGESPVPRH